MTPDPAQVDVAELRPCARCGTRTVFGGPDDLTCCDGCAADIGYGVALDEVQRLIHELRPPNHQTRAWWSLNAAHQIVNDLRAAREQTP